MSNTGFHTFVILGAMRTGSNFLERSLSQHDDIACHGELFNPDFFGKKDAVEAFGLTLAEREANPLAILKALRKEPASLCGFRLFEGHDARVMEAVLADAGVAKIILHRPALDSYISLRIAQETDQWILGNARSRKSAKITFEQPAFERYRDHQRAFYADLSRRMQLAGQSAFHIGFSQLSDLDVLNGLLAYLGLRGTLERPDNTLKPQNPGGYDNKVTNPEALAPYLDAGAETTVPRAPQLKRFVTSDTYPLLFAPVAGNQNAAIVDWMDGQGRHSQASLKAWQDANAGFTAFSVVGHPLARAYRAFCQRIALEGPHGFPKIRRRLVRFHGLELPQEGDAPDVWQQAFARFLEFLERNLAGQTGIRIDDDWAQQCDLIAAISAQQPVAQIFREDALARGLAQFGDGAGPSIEDAPAKAPPLAEIYSDQLERMCRKTYRKDYRKFGFSDWLSGRN